MADELEVRHLDGLRADVTDPRAPRLVGHAIRTGVLSEDLGGFREIIAPEAVRRALDPQSGLARARQPQSESCRRAPEREDVDASSPMPTACGSRSRRPRARRDVVESVQRGDVTGASFRFGVPPGGDAWDFATTPPTRTVTDMAIHELSVGCPFPAYPQTHVAALRSLEAPAADPWRSPPMEPTCPRDRRRPRSARAPRRERS